MLSVGVLCGGRGTRISAIAGILPKALVPVDGVPFLAHQLGGLAGAGVRHVVLLTGYRGDLIREFAGDGSEFGLRITYSDDGASPRGTGGAVRAALPLLGDPFFTVYGDALLTTPFDEIAASLRPEDLGVMTVFQNRDHGLPSNVRLEDLLVAAYDKQAAPGTMTHIDYGVNLFRATAFTDTPRDRPVDLSEIHRAMINRRSLRAFTVSDRWYEIGSPEGLAETERYVRSLATS